MSWLKHLGTITWDWLMPSRPSAYDRQLLVLVVSLMLFGLVMVASASITEGLSLRNDAFFFVKRHLVFLLVCLLIGVRITSYNVCYTKLLRVGLAPVSNPRFVMVVVINEPKGDAYYGGSVAGPTFAEVMSAALQLYNVPPDALPETSYNFV